MATSSAEESVKRFLGFAKCLPAKYFGVIPYHALNSCEGLHGAAANALPAVQLSPAPNLNKPTPMAA